MQTAARGAASKQLPHAAINCPRGFALPRSIPYTPHQHAGGLQAAAWGAIGSAGSSLAPASHSRGLRPRLVPTSCASSSIQPPHEGHEGPHQQQQAIPLPPSLLAGLTATVTAVTKVGNFLACVLDRARSAVASVFPQIDNITAQDVHQQLRSLSSNMRLLALIMPLARAASSESLTALYARTFERAAFGFAKMYLFCLFMRVLLSWFPGIDWNAQPWTFLRLITEPYLQIYRGILPPLFGQLDFTPLFGFLILQDVVEVMAPTYTMGLHDHDTSTRWTTSDVMCYFDGF